MRNLILASVLCLCAGCTYVEPGCVGLKVNYYGTSRGVDEIPVVTGRVWYNPWTTDIISFPTYMQQAVWAKHQDDKDESITFNSVEGNQLNADVGLTYSVDSAKVPYLYVHYRKDIDLITHDYLRIRVRQAVNNASEKHKTMDIIGPQRSAILADALTALKKELEPQGFILDSLAFISAVRANPEVQASINLAIQATQEAIKAENKVLQMQAEAEQAVATAKGSADSRKLEADAEAYSITQKAEAQAAANRLLKESLSPELIQMELAKRWDGVIPPFGGLTGSNSLLPVLDLTRAANQVLNKAE